VPRRCAFLIGNQEYRPDSHLQPLGGPRNDVAALKKLLIEDQIGRYDRVESLCDKSKADILEPLDEALQGATRDDLILIFYSGHGLWSRGELCLATFSTCRAKILSTCIPISELRRMIHESHCGTKILLLDCCFAGAAADGFRGDVPSALERIGEARGVHLLAAAGGAESSKETKDEIVMGCFTKEVVHGIASGEADSNKDHVITMTDLVSWLRLRELPSTPQYTALKAEGDPALAWVRHPQRSPEFRWLIELHDREEISTEQYRYFWNVLAGQPASDPSFADTLRKWLISRLAGDALVAAMEVRLRRLQIEPPF
jgi:uncharacterized caspase-like protein